MWVATRPTTAEPFGTPVNLDNFSLGSRINTSSIDLWPQITRDSPAPGSKFYFTSNRSPIGIFEATWASSDCDANGVLGAADVDLLSAEIGAGTNQSQFDLDGDRRVDEDDHGIWVKDAMNTWFGDANLDGEFNSSDMVQVFTGGKYETEQEAGWAEGDWNASGFFDSGDMVAAFTDGGYEQGQRTAAQSVPEPTSVLPLMIRPDRDRVLPKSRPVVISRRVIEMERDRDHVRHRGRA